MNKINVVSGGCLSKMTHSVLFSLCVYLRIIALDCQNKCLNRSKTSSKSYVQMPQLYPSCDTEIGRAYLVALFGISWALSYSWLCHFWDRGSGRTSGEVEMWVGRKAPWGAHFSIQESACFGGCSEATDLAANFHAGFACSHQPPLFCLLLWTEWTQKIFFCSHVLEGEHKSPLMF